jgi:hypothetical protein
MTLPEHNCYPEREPMGVHIQAEQKGVTDMKDIS